MPSNEEITALMTKGDEFQDLTQSILHNLSNIKTNPSTSKSEFTSTLKSMQQNVITIQNDIKIKMHTLLAVQNSINTSIIPTQMSIDMYIQKFDELNNEISKHTKYAANLVNMLNRVKVNDSAQKDINETPILVVMPTYNRSEFVENSIKMINNQTYNNWVFLIIDDGSTEIHKHKFRKIQKKYQSDKIVFQENMVNCHIAKTLNKGIRYLGESDKGFTHFTWISDDNEYYPHFLTELYNENTFFKYSEYDFQKVNLKSKYTNKTQCANKKSYQGYHDILNNFSGCAAFMWTKKAINEIGFYDETIPGCEDFEYLLRTFKLNELDCKFIPISTMKYIIHTGSCFEKEKEQINILKNELTSIYTPASKKEIIETNADIFQINKIKQLVCSDCFSHFSLRFKNKFNLVDYSNNNEKTAYFGIYSINDINNIKLNTTTKYIIFGGTDVDLILGNKELKKLFDSIDKKVLFHISDNIGDRLKNYGYTSIEFPLDLTDKTIFKKVNTDELGKNIFIYNGRVKGLVQNYGKEIYEEFVRRNPHFTYIYSNELNEPYENMPNVYKKCFIGLRLTDKDGNANMVRELECMGIPVIHNQSNYGIKWKTVEDIERIVDSYNCNEELLIEKYPIDFSNFYKLSDDMLIKVYNNINNFTKYIHKYRNILLICGDYPGYGGAATNCLKLSNYLENICHNVYSIYFNYEVNGDIKYGHFSNYCIINNSEIKTTLKSLSFEPDLIILKSPIGINIKTIINNCPIYYLIGGIYLNDLDKNYNVLNNKIEQDKYINEGVLSQIKNCDKSFCNSLHTQQILKEYYEIKTELFYSSFIQYHNENVINDNDFEKRTYDYGLIVSNFNRKIKNVEESIQFLKDKQNVILIGKGSSNYKSYGFECVELVEYDKMTNYYKEIKYIVQDSFYESCSNVKVEGLFNGCLIHPNIIINNINEELVLNSKTPIIESELTDNFGILLIQQYPNNFFEEYIHFLTKKLLMFNISPIIFIYYSSTVEKKLIQSNLIIEYVNDTNIYNIMVNKYNLKTLLILYLPLSKIDSFLNFDRLMTNCTITKYIFLGGIVNHMYEYIDKYNITNTIGYGNGYKLLYNNINHYNLKELFYPEYDYKSIICNKNRLKKHFIHIGRFSSEKNQIFLIKAFHNFMKDINDFSYKLFVVGRNDNQIKKNINDYILQNKLYDNIVLMDWMIQSSLFDFCIKEIDYNIITSTNEGLSSICLEMMKIGIPTISSNICCINEIISHDVNGLLFDYYNYFDLLSNNKNNASNLVDEINKNIDINMACFINVVKNTVNNLPLLNKLSEGCFRFIEKFDKNNDDYSNIFNINYKKKMQLYIAEHLRTYYRNDLFNTQTIGNYTFIDLYDYNQPCLFYGLFSEYDLNVFKKMNNTTMIVWTGGDINSENRSQSWIESHIKNNINAIKEKTKYIKIIHIAITDAIEKSLINHGLKYEIFNFMGINFNDYNPIIKGDKIYIYVGDGSEAYGASIYLQLHEILKDKYDFIFTSSHKDDKIRNKLVPELNNKGVSIINVEKNKIKSLYSQIFINLRLTKHDGLSATVQELGCMGITSVNNCINSPSVEKYSDLNSIIKIIDDEYIHRHRIDKIIKTSNETINYLKIGNKMLDLLANHRDILFVLNQNKNQKINGIGYIYNVALQLKKHYMVDYVFIQDLDKINHTSYKYIILDAVLLNPFLNDYSHDKIIEIVNTYFSKKIVIILMHDLHWWSFDSNYCFTELYKKYIDNIENKLFEKNEYYYKNITLLEKLNIKYFISLYNNKEMQNYIEDCNFIDKFYINHYSEQTQFNYIENSITNNVIVLYGACNKSIYPLRNKIHTFIENKKDENYKNIEMDYYGDNKNEINIELNKSWLACATPSIFNYTVRKYFEIPITQATLICDATLELLNIVQNNYIYIHKDMNNEMINKIIDYYIDNKEILCYLSYNCKKLISKNNSSESYYNRLNSIFISIKQQKNNELEYNEYNNSLNKLKFINYYYVKQKINEYEENCIYKIHKDKQNIYNLEIYKQDCDGYCYIYLDKPNISSENLLNYGEIFKIKKYKFIDQVYVSQTLSYFKKYLLDNNNLLDYRYNNIPTFFYGIWADSIEIIKQTNDVKILIFTGGDILTNLSIIHELINNANTYVISISKSICNILKNNNIRHVYFPYYAQLNIEYEFKNNNKNKILYYTSFNPKTYDLDMILLLEELLPQYKIIFTSNKEHLTVANRNKEKLINLFGEEKFNFIQQKIVILPHDELLKLIDESFIYLRPTPNDGLGQLSIECALKGIRTLNNSIGTSNCINYNEKDISSIIQLINNEYKNQNNENSKYYQQCIVQNIKNELHHPLKLYTEIYYKNNINYYFDKIYVLNLKRENNRRTRIEKQFDVFNINNYRFFEAIDGLENKILMDKYEQYSKIPFTNREIDLGRKLIGSVGVLANLVSVKNIIMDAKKNKYNKILFMEDDVIFHKEFNSLFNDITSKIDDDWKILYLGVQNILNEKTIITNNTYNCNINSSGGWSFGIDSSVYDELIHECNKEILPFDSGPLYYLRENYPTKCKVIYPNLCICDTTNSSIRQYKRELKNDAINYKWNLDDYSILE